MSKSIDIESYISNEVLLSLEATLFQPTVKETLIIASIRRYISIYTIPTRYILYHVQR